MHSTLLKSLLFVAALNVPGTVTTALAQTARKAAPQPRQPLTAPIPFDRDVKVGKLPNGLTYYIRKNAEPANRAELRLVVRAGSVLENDAQQGLAHFMEHMAFNGTKNFPKNELVNFLQSSGIRFGADLNAYTSFDETVYELPVPTDSANVFEQSMQILEDWAHNVTLDPAEVEKERGVVLEEWRLGRGAQQRMRDKYFPFILNNSRYANRLPIGKDSIIRNFKPAVLRDFYKTWYRPDLMAVVAVGDFDVNQVEAMIRQKFGRIPKATTPLPRPTFTIPPHKDTKVVIVTDNEQPNTIVQIIYKRPQLKEKTLGDLRSDIVRDLFNGMLGNRIQELTQQADPPFLYGYSNYGSFLGNLDAFTAFAVAKEGNIERAIRALLDENARVKQFGFTPTELARAKTDLLRGIEQAYLERDKTRSANYVGEYVGNFTDQEPVVNIGYYFDFVKQHLDGIKLTEVNGLVDQFIRNENRAVVLMAPEKDKAKLPSVEQVIGYVDAAGQGLTAYNDNVLDKPLLAKAPVPGKIISEQKLDKIGVTELRLSNGVRVVLKPTNFKNDQILFSGNSLGGTSRYELADFQSARFASTLVSLGGTGEYSQVQLGKFLAGKALNVSPYIGELNEGVSGGTAPKDLETALQLLYSYFTQPRKDADVVAGFLSNQKSALANQLATPTPQKVFQDTVSVTLGNNNPRRQPLTPADLDRISLDRALQIYNDRFADASNFTFTFVGNFDPIKVRPLLETYLGGLPSTQSNETFRDLGIRAPEGQLSKTVRRGVDPKASVQLVYTGNFDWTPENAVQVDALAEVLEIKLIEKLREEESGVYGVSASGVYGRYPVPRYTFRINFGCAPENVEKLVASVNREVAKLKATGADAKDIAKFKAETQREQEVQLRDNNFWLSYLANQYYNGDDPQEVLRQPELLKTVTVESTKAAANTYLGNNLIKFVLLPTGQ
ncbi:peptidase M16 domain protein [Fibrella aestuarina BUZ 2]|uniref:Peptidase M16 domain protein n=1 Tax=Fibrella aestuarina BUZ 2 TaxID=1166018 RepID=I0KGD1_9BACT|nr:M16 family metallopeptidase [Fibrella aestuarina]CCH03184.1 peptidase M16 domain protein [Fibrella aestuarina BUZ 2]